MRVHLGIACCYLVTSCCRRLLIHHGATCVHPLGMGLNFGTCWHRYLFPRNLRIIHVDSGLFLHGRRRWILGLRFQPRQSVFQPRQSISQRLYSPVGFLFIGNLRGMPDIAHLNYIIHCFRHLSQLRLERLLRYFPSGTLRFHGPMVLVQSLYRSLKLCLCICLGLGILGDDPSNGQELSRNWIYCPGDGT